MKKYIAPATEIIRMEYITMIAASNEVELKESGGNAGTMNSRCGGSKSSSIWDDED